MRSQVLAVVALLCATVSAQGEEQPRIVSLDGGTTETLFALGLGPMVVGRDSGSTYPPEALDIPEIGQGHQINLEGVLSLRPTVVVGRDRMMSGPSLHLLEHAKVKVLRLDDAPGVEPAKRRILELGRALDRETQAAGLVKAIERDLDTLAMRLKHSEGPSASVLIVYVRPGVSMLMGEDSNASAMVSLVGAKHALPGLKGYKDMNAEAVIAARPDVVLCYSDGLEAVGGPDALWKLPGLKETPAGRAKRLVAMDDRLLAGFGPRTGEAALTLYDRLNEPMKQPVEADQ